MEKEILYINIDDLVISDNNVRKNKEPLDQNEDDDQTNIDTMKQSIQQFGLLNPLTISEQKEGKYHVIAGQRRFHALKQLGYKSIPCRIVKTQSDEEQQVISLIENIQRNKMTTYDKLNAIKKLYEYHDKDIKKVCKSICLSEQVVRKYIKISNNINQSVIQQQNMTLEQLQNLSQISSQFENNLKEQGKNKEEIKKEKEEMQNQIVQKIQENNSNEKNKILNDTKKQLKQNKRSTVDQTKQDDMNIQKPFLYDKQGKTVYIEQEYWQILLDQYYKLKNK